MLVDKQSIFKLRDGAALYGGDGVGGKYWLFDTISGQHFRLNHVGHLALSLVDGQRTVKDIINACSDRYPAHREQVELDIDEFFGLCVQKEVLTIEGAHSEQRR